jgi:hypothetical protein
MSKAWIEALVNYQSGDLAAALDILRGIDDDSLPLQGLALKANIHARSGQPREAGELFLKASRMAGADHALMAKLAAKMFAAAGATDLLASAGPHLLDAAPGDANLVFDVLTALYGTNGSASALPHIRSLDLSNPAHAMLAINIARSAGDGKALLDITEAALVHRPDDGLFNAERFSAAIDLCDFPVISDCIAKASDPASVSGRNMLAAQSLHRRLMWTDDPILMATPGLEHFLLRQDMQQAVPLPRRTLAKGAQRIRIAYLSNDFYNHATMILLRGVLLAHDRQRFDIRLFCYTPQARAGEQAGWPALLRNSIEPVRDLSDLDAAQAISRWGADILIDLKGYTGGARLNIVRLSDAPVKVTYLGYPGSVSGAGIDYAITDRIVTPDEAIPFYEEKLCRLPESYQANDGEGRPLPTPAHRAQHGLPDDAFVFASFNSSYKITASMIGLWARILDQCPQSVLWILCPQGPVRANLLAEFAGHGIAPERIIFAGFAAYPAHVSRVALADLVLDTFPCNGHTTTSDVLWGGVPVVALSGESFAARVSESLLAAIGLPELAVNSTDTYVDLAVGLYRDRKRLSGLRATLSNNRSTMPLFDSERTTRHLERAYEQMARRAQAGLPPALIDVEPLPPREVAMVHAESSRQD